jgi:hypothetical protein
MAIRQTQTRSRTATGRLARDAPIHIWHSGPGVGTSIGPASRIIVARRRIDADHGGRIDGATASFAAAGGHRAAAADERRSYKAENYFYPKCVHDVYRLAPRDDQVWLPSRWT